MATESGRDNKNSNWEPKPDAMVLESPATNSLGAGQRVDYKTWVDVPLHVTLSLPHASEAELKEKVAVFLKRVEIYLTDECARHATEANYGFDVANVWWVDDPMKVTVSYESMVIDEKGRSEVFDDIPDYLLGSTLGAVYPSVDCADVELWLSKSKSSKTTESTNSEEGN